MIISDKHHIWDAKKNAFLKLTRGVGFEDVVNALSEGGLLTIINNPNMKTYPEQQLYVVVMKSYVYVIPYAMTKDYIFLKTIYPSRKYKKLFYS